MRRPSEQIRILPKIPESRNLKAIDSNIDPLSLVQVVVERLASIPIIKL
jgi:hypothetical protein